MTPLQIAIAAVVASGGLIGSTAGVVQLADSRYVSQGEFSDLLWSQLKERLRSLRKDLESDPGNQGIKDEIEATLDRLCKNYPEDRDCK